MDYTFFHYFLPQLNETLAIGFSAEMVAFRGYLESQIFRLTLKSTGEGMGRSLEIEESLLQVFENMETILRSVALSSLAPIIVNQPAVKAIID